MSTQAREEKKQRTFSDTISDGNSDFSMDAFPMISTDKQSSAIKQIERISAKGDMLR